MQIGISLIGILSGAVGEAALSDPLAGVLSEIVPGLAPYAGAITFGVVVCSITYLTPKGANLLLGCTAHSRHDQASREVVTQRGGSPRPS